MNAELELMQKRYTPEASGGTVFVSTGSRMQLSDSIEGVHDGID